MTLDEIRSLLDAMPPNEDAIIQKGNLLDLNNCSVEFKIHHGWDIAHGNLCDKLWGEFNIKLLRHVRDNCQDENLLETEISNLSLEDSHWEWFKKSIACRTDEYHWFFLSADSKPQGACLIYHPKQSIFDKGNIFYIEYLAVAPWNRQNPMSNKQFSGIGSILIKSAIAYSCNALRLRPGFSLHSLPKAKTYYERIGMQHFPSLDKDQLNYFEMAEAKAAQYAGAV
ncbi:hypothetical protein ACN079_06490 [Pseudomonas sp. ABY48]|uniref:hypothetical protein n=1 Tax=Pseudomonas sp. ABY48 TaxID=3402865 RepID=UPI003B43ACAD